MLKSIAVAALIAFGTVALIARVPALRKVAGL